MVRDSPPSLRTCGDIPLARPAGLLAAAVLLLATGSAIAAGMLPRVPESAAPRQEDRAAQVSRVSARIARRDPRIAAWGAFEARTLQLSECLPALVERLRRTPVEVDDAGRTAALRLGLLDALVALDASLAVEDAPVFYVRGPWPTLLMIALHPEGQAPFLRELVERTAGDRATPLWLAPRLLLVQARDAGYAVALLRSWTPRLELELLDPPAPGPKSMTIRCAGVGSTATKAHWSESVWIPEGFPPTAWWHPTDASGPESTLLAETHGHSLSLERSTITPGSGLGSGRGGRSRSTKELERDLLLGLALGPPGIELALDGWSRSLRWSGHADLERRLEEWQSEFDEARASLLELLTRRAGLAPEEIEDVLEPQRVLVDARSEPWPPVGRPKGWTRLEANAVRK